MWRGDVLIDRALGVDPGKQVQELDMFGGGARDGEVRVAAAVVYAVPGLVAQHTGSAVAATAPAAGGGQAVRRRGGLQCRLEQKRVVSALGLHGFSFGWVFGS